MAVFDINIEDLDKFICCEKVCLLDVWAKWCMPCKVMSPIFDDISEKYPEICFARIEADANNIVGEKLDITSIPAFLLYKNGKLINKKSGMMTIDELEEIIILSDD